MYFFLLNLHSYVRWLVLASLVFALFLSISGLIAKRKYAKIDHIGRILVSSVGHTQLLIGATLYFFSPTALHFLKIGFSGDWQVWFFGFYHNTMMFIAIVVMTIGGSVIKKTTDEHQKLKNTAIYFGISFCLILLAIPWFRPLLRLF